MVTAGIQFTLGEARIEAWASFYSRKSLLRVLHGRSDDALRLFHGPSPRPPPHQATSPSACPLRLQMLGEFTIRAFRENSPFALDLRVEGGLGV